MKYLLIVLFLVVGIFMRIMPFAPNFTPLLSIALLSGLYTKNKYFIILPISIMLVSDIIIGNHVTVFWVYTSLAIIFMLGYFVSRSSYLQILQYSIFSSLIFFTVSNFGVWVTGGYTFDFNGLLSCYISAIPFFKNTLFSTCLFSLSINFIVNLIPAFYKQIRAN